MAKNIILKIRDEVSERRLFELYVARVGTIDRYRVPITDRGVPAAFRTAFDEAKVALDVYRDLINGGDEK